MAVIRRSALVRLPSTAMFDLVNDVTGYARRFEWCESSEVLAASDSEMLARLQLRIAGVSATFSTRNALQRPERIELTLEEGPFRQLRGLWTFSELSDEACKVALEMDFEPAGRLVGSALALGFERVADRMVDDFCRVAMKEAR
jgi:ribosome-associated toxin RatA of RatAB toxin-antitoxin module